MSRLAKKPLQIPSNVKVSVEQDNVIVEGKLGKNTQKFRSDMVNIKIENNNLFVTGKNNTPEEKPYIGLYFRLIRNMIIGVTEGFSKRLEIHGLGYKWEIKGKELVLNVGFSKPVKYPIPDGIKTTIEEVNKVSNLVITGIDKCFVGQFAANVRAIKPPEPYKGKGIRYANERIVLKEGKSAKK